MVARPPRAPPECEGNTPVTCTIGRTGGSGERHRSEHAGSRGGGRKMVRWVELRGEEGAVPWSLIVIRLDHGKQRSDRYGASQRTAYFWKGRRAM